MGRSQTRGLVVSCLDSESWHMLRFMKMLLVIVRYHRLQHLYRFLEKSGPFERFLGVWMDG